MSEHSRSAWTHRPEVNSLKLNWKSNGIETKEVSEEKKKKLCVLLTNTVRKTQNQPITAGLAIKINLQLYTVSFLYKCIKHLIWLIYILKQILRLLTNWNGQPAAAELSVCQELTLCTEQILFSVLRFIWKKHNIQQLIQAGCLLKKVTYTDAVPRCQELTSMLIKNVVCERNHWQFSL